MMQYFFTADIFLAAKLWFYVSCTVCMEDIDDPMSSSLSSPPPLRDARILSMSGISIVSFVPDGKTSVTVWGPREKCVISSSFGKSTDRKSVV